jgi:hypothetical protein
MGDELGLGWPGGGLAVFVARVIVVRFGLHQSVALWRMAQHGPHDHFDVR